ncbi:MAG TPA: hydantoinase B/oxoprolinase family protein [Thermaerobacter sp.]
MDPFTIEVIKEGLQATAQEMFIALGQSSQSPIIYEVLDYATGVTDGQGRLVAQGQGVPGFIGCLDFAVREALSRFGDQLHPGDIVALNDPFLGGGTHLSDVTLLMPVFAGGRRVAFVASKAHWTEVGGMHPGSWSPDATEVYQEGLQLPCVKVVERGRTNHALLDVIAANVRLPEQTLGDFWAQVAALKAGARRLDDLCRRYGVDGVLEAMDALQRQGLAITRQALAAIPEGVYEAEDFIDGDELAGADRLPVRVRVTVRDGRMICDFAGSAPQVPGPLNCTRSVLISSVRAAFKAVTDPAFPACDGCFEPLEVVCPPGTIFTARRPAATSTYFEVDQMACDLVLKALAPVVPHRLTAGHYLSVCGTLLAGRGDDGADWLLVEPQVGGWGAAAHRDGTAALFNIGDGETYILPAEVAEARYPVRLERFALNTEPGGEGRYRGGFGCVREYRVLAPAFLTASFGRHRTPPWGVAGGRPGTPNRIRVLDAAGRLRWEGGRVARLPLEPGDRVVLITGVGGGWGPPEARDPADIARDAACGYQREPVE